MCLRALSGPAVASAEMQDVLDPRRRQHTRFLLTRVQHEQGPMTFLKNNQKVTRVDSRLSLD